MRNLAEKVIEGLIVLGILYICLTVNGCNMVSGLGQDIHQMAATYVEDE